MALDKKQVSTCLQECKHHLSTELLPFWLNRAKDDKYGGFVTHFDKDGRDSGTDEKSMLGQMRFIFSMSTAHRAGYGGGQCAEFARHGVDFVLNYTFYARQDTRTPAIVGVIAVAFALNRWFALSERLASRLAAGHAGRGPAAGAGAIGHEKADRSLHAQEPRRRHCDGPRENVLHHGLAQPERAKEVVTAFGRVGGHVVGFVANNSAVASGQIDCDSAVKIARFVRFCNIYNIPIVFMEDTTGFLPGREQEARGIVQAGRSMLDAIVDVRTPRILLILRNAFGGAYASYNNYPTGADLVIALPTTRLAVMGPAGKEFVYKDELRKARGQAAEMVKKGVATRTAAGMDGAQAKKDAEKEAGEWLKQQEAALNRRYEKELMNPKEGLALGSISSLVMPTDLREVLAKNLQFLIRHYKPAPMTGPQREFH